MVRLEKIAYERLVNIKVFNRARTIDVPKKWYATNPSEQEAMNSHRIVNSWIGRLLKPFFGRLVQYELRYLRDLYLSQGLAPEDRKLHSESELRRDNLFEHMARENLHPYHIILKGKRRERFYRIQRCLPGFFVPNHVRAEAANQTFSTAMALKKQWNKFVHDNYFSDMTPSSHFSVTGKLIPLEIILFYGILKPEAWDQYFYNEPNQHWFSQQKMAIVRDPRRFPYDLTTPEGKKEFEDTTKTFVEKNPGILVPQGQTFDFKAYYAKIGV